MSKAVTIPRATGRARAGAVRTRRSRRCGGGRVLELEGAERWNKIVGYVVAVAGQGGLLENECLRRPEPLHTAGRPGTAAWPPSPSGAGPRQCVGNVMALLELRVIVAMITQRFHASNSAAFPAVRWDTGRRSSACVRCRT
ncbi:cytochrome P450 [Streptomyces sp. NPDC004647]|uniref:cytochrome P450 n=1 Tax=Streptomyces sp. NPDC004647 TaxID=3154671 RepID=UPI00339E7671